MLDDNITMFGDLICRHLVDNFGEEITFLDPKYRPNVRGCVHYVCNDMEHVKRVTRDLRDSILVTDFLQAVGQSPDVESSVNNMTNYLVGISNTADMIHLYELLWPEEPLPHGKYKLEDVRDIIIAKTVDSKMRMPQQSRLNIIDIYNPEYY